MAKIDQGLLQAIADKQSMVVRAVYPQIAKVVHDTFLERDLAALVLASRLRIQHQQILDAGPARADRRTSHRRRSDSVCLPGGRTCDPSARPQQACEGSPSAKDNSVFVIGGRDTAHDRIDV